MFRSSLTFEDNETFERHLKSRSEDIKSTISSLSSQSPVSSAELSELQAKLSKKLAEEKVSIIELEKVIFEKQQLEEQLEAASLRYMVAEKKLDRARSGTVAKFEKQLLLGPQRPGNDATPSASKEEASATNGGSPGGDKDSDLEEAYHKTLAQFQKQKEQIEALEAENRALTSQVTGLTVKVYTLHPLMNDR
jgi:E3 ubiquitin-protein ligase BRE1